MAIDFTLNYLCFLFQIFYLQQSYLQLRVGSSSSTAPPPDSNNPISRPAVQPKEDQSLVVIEEKLLKVEQGLNSCVPMEKFDQLTQSISEREAQSSGELQQVSIQEMILRNPVK